MKKEEDILHKPFNYYLDDDFKSGIVTNIIPTPRGKWVSLDNGDQIPIDEFMNTATPMMDEFDEFQDEKAFNQEEEHEYRGESNIPSMNIKTDRNGVPILKPDLTEDDWKKIKSNPNISDIDEFNDEKVSKHNTPSSKSKVPQNVDPLFLVLEKAILTPKSFDIKVDIGIFAPEFIKVMVATFGPEAEEKIMQFIKDKFDIQLFYDKLKEELKKHYMG